MPDSVATMLERFGGPRRALIVIVGLATAGLIFALAQWASAPTYVPAFTGVPLESVSQMTDKLDQAGVQYKLERGGADIMVATQDLAKARVALARGGIPNSGRPGMELFDQPSWGMTDFTQRVNYRRALEGELERTIGKMQGIESAQVHLVMHETDGFAAADKPTEASVVLKTHGEPDPDVVKGISHLVASSVEGLTSERVTIVDDAGRMLSEGEEASSPTGLTSRQLAMQREIESYLRDKAEKIVSEMVGPSNMRVQVSANMSFDQIERTTASIDPDKQAVASEQKAEIVPGAQGGAGQTNSSTTYDNTRSTESVVAAPGTIKRLTVAVLVADRAPAAGSKTPAQPRSAEELQQIETLVRSAVGADSTRGDIVSVVSVPFAPVPVVATQAPTRDVVSVVRDVQRPVIGLVGLGLVVVVAMLMLKGLKSGSSGTQVLSLPRQDAMAPQLTSGGYQPSAVVSSNGMRDRVSSAIEQQPDVAARVVRAWLKEA